MESGTQRQPWPRGLPLTLAVVILLSAVQIALQLRRRPSAPAAKGELSAEQQRSYADQLVSNDLPRAAIEQYRRLLALPDTPERKANLHYRIAELYQDDLGDYESALAEYVLIQSVYADTAIADKVGPRMVVCLEKLGRSTDAQRQLERQTSLSGAPAPPSDSQTVAVIGTRKITYSDLEREIRALPDFVRRQINTPEQKLDFLRQYVATELLYAKAQRSGVGDDPKVKEQLASVKRSVMVQKLMEDQVAGRVKVSPEEVRKYYAAHKEKYAGDDGQPRPFDEVQRQARDDLVNERRQAAIQALLAEEMKAQEVRIFDDVFTSADEEQP